MTKRPQGKESEPRGQSLLRGVWPHPSPRQFVNMHNCPLRNLQRHRDLANGRAGLPRQHHQAKRGGALWHEKAYRP